MHEKATSGYKSYDSWGEAKAKLTEKSSANVVKLMLALIVVRSATSSLNASSLTLTT